MIYVADLGTVARVYADDDKSPEMTVKLGQASDMVGVGETVTLSNAPIHSASSMRPLPTAVCEAEVVAIAVIVKPKWDTLRNPHSEREQGSLL